MAIRVLIANSDFAARGGLRRRDRRRALDVALAAAALHLCSAGSALAQTEDPDPVPGHQRYLSVPRIAEGAPVVDGDLADAVWSRAAYSTGFWNSIQDRPPSDQTEILVLMDDENLYFGFRLHDDQPDAIQSTRAVRDVGLGYDDSITIELDTFFNRRGISEFSVNPIGTQDDEIAGGRSAKIEWKGDWSGSATRTDFGWSAEFAIPLAILNYEDDADRFGINFKRYQSRTREYSYWADVSPQILREEMGQLRDLELPETAGRKAWTFMPFLLAGSNVPDEDGVIRDTLAEVGIDIRYQPRPDLTGMFALNPDFSQVEEAVTDISFSYSEKAVDENRAFFIEGADYFASEEEYDYFYSNRIPDFDLGAKAFGRIGEGEYGVLATKTQDDRVDVVARTLMELNETNSVGAGMVRTGQDGSENMLTFFQSYGRHARSGFTYSMDAAYTDTEGYEHDPDTPIGGGQHYSASLGWQGNYLYVRAAGDEYEADYYPGNALLDDDLPGTKGSSLIAGFYREMSHDLWRVVQGYAGATYRDTATGERQEEKAYGYGSIELNSDVRFSVYAEEGPYRPVTDVRGVFETAANDDRYYSFVTDFNTRSNRIAGGVQYDWGDLGGASYQYVSGYTWWRPVNSLFLSLSLERTDSFGISDQGVLMASWDITPEHSLAARYIYSDQDEYYRLAYSRRLRQGVDIYAVYDSNPFAEDEFSLKFVSTF